MKIEYQDWKITISRQMKYKGNDWLGVAKKDDKGFNVDGTSPEDVLDKIRKKIETYV